MTVKEQVKALWRICFQDSEEFIDLYFRLRYKNEVNAVIQNGDKVVSALQMLPYPMTFCGKTVQTSYISMLISLEGEGITSDKAIVFVEYLNTEAYPMWA